MSKPLLWHYTIAEKASEIVKAGELRPTHFSPSARPTLWFSSNQNFELTVRHSPEDADGSTESELLRLATAYGIARFGVARKISVPIHRFGGSFDRRARTTTGTAKKLAETGRRWRANPDEWWYTFEAVRMADWACVQCLIKMPYGSWEYQNVEPAVFGRK